MCLECVLVQLFDWLQAGGAWQEQHLAKAGVREVVHLPGAAVSCLTYGGETWALAGDRDSGGQI